MRSGRSRPAEIKARINGLVERLGLAVEQGPQAVGQLLVGVGDLDRAAQLFTQRAEGLEQLGGARGQAAPHPGHVGQLLDQGGDAAGEPGRALEPAQGHRARPADDRRERLGLGVVGERERRPITHRQPGAGVGGGEQGRAAARIRVTLAVVAPSADQIAEHLDGELLAAVGQQGGAVQRLLVHLVEQLVEGETKAPAVGHGARAAAAPTTLAQPGEDLEGLAPALDRAAPHHHPKRDHTAGDGGLAHREVLGEVVDEPLGRAPARREHDHRLHPAEHGPGVAGRARPGRRVEGLAIHLGGPEQRALVEGRPGHRRRPTGQALGGAPQPGHRDAAGHAGHRASVRRRGRREDRPNQRRALKVQGGGRLGGARAGPRPGAPP